VWCNADVIMCHRYKLASLNWWLSVVTLLRWWKTWFTGDKFLKFYSRSHKRYMQSNRIYVSLGIVGLSDVWARQCTITSSLREGWIFGSLDAWFHVPMSLIAETIKKFHQCTRWSSPSKQGRNWELQKLWAQLISKAGLHTSRISVAAPV